MKIAFVQYDIAWESPTKNHNKIEHLLADSHEQFDLLILPEMFTTGFSMNTKENAESMDGPTLKWLAKISESYHAVVTGSIIIKEKNNFYNRLIWMRPNGVYDVYDKRHLFTLAKEDQYFAAGNERLVLELEVNHQTWRICPLICYDLRFPVWSRNTENFDLLIYVANFPEKRAYAWSQLLIARAIENQCYVIGVNRVGVDGVKVPYSGKSVAVRYDGKIIENAESEEGLFYVNVSKEKQLSFRRAYNFLNDRDQFEIL